MEMKGIKYQPPKPHPTPKPQPTPKPEDKNFIENCKISYRLKNRKTKNRRES